jgi:hypothetical protein
LSNKSPKRIKKRFPYSYSIYKYNKDMKGVKDIKNTTKDKRVMPLDKAMKLLDDYKRNNFNGYKTLIQNGYSDNHALKQARLTLNVAKERIQQALEIEGSTKEIAERASDLYSIVGLTRDDIIKEYQSIVKQNINIAVKLRALEPLLRQEGIKWDEKEEQKAPSVVIKVDEVHNHPDNTLITKDISEQVSTT